MFSPTLIRCSRPFVQPRHRSGRPIIAPSQPIRVKPPLPKAPEIDVPSLVVYEDRKVLIIDKPAGFSIQGSYGSIARIKYDALVSELKSRVESPEIFPVHRLDKSTTGILVFSKSSQSAKVLNKAWDSVHRAYLAVINNDKGEMHVGATGEIIDRLRTDSDRVNIVEEGELIGKDALTSWTCLDSSPTHSLLKLVPSTGRKHQLRVHCANTFGSIVGDYKYDMKTDHRALLDLPADTILLHSFSASFFTYAKNGTRSTIETSVDPPFVFLKFCKLAGLDIATISPPAPSPIAAVAPIEIQLEATT